MYLYKNIVPCVCVCFNLIWLLAKKHMSQSLLVFSMKVLSDQFNSSTLVRFQQRKLITRFLLFQFVHFILFSFPIPRCWFQYPLLVHFHSVLNTSSYFQLKVIRYIIVFVRAVSIFIPRGSFAQTFCIIPCTVSCPNYTVFSQLPIVLSTTVTPLLYSEFTLYIHKQ